MRGSKPGDDRALYLTPALIGALQRFLPPAPRAARRGPHLLAASTPALCLDHPRQADQIRQANRAARHAHIVLRHTFATRLINRGLSIQSLRKLIGHRSINTTMIYAQLYDETLHAQFRDAMSQMESIVVEDWPQPRIALPILAEGGGLAAGAD